ncbi:ATP-binding protein [Streptomyces sp. FXJ1.4098]|uniref:ATP-binding protein n=1 Tax=Streptomyces sp. NPDC020845 TaxID=3365096 RepID=UPI00299C417E|nr:ATP-binding protein [Streptomyces sp. FXJ1.4098]
MTSLSTTAQAAATGHPGYSECMPRIPESAAAARLLVRTALAAWGIENLTDDGELIVSEMVTNTVDHARGDAIRVIVTRPSEDTVQIAVVDKDKRRPQARTAGADTEHGRGLFLVAAFAEDWGVEPKPWGKLVWATLTSKEQR